jgi:glycosyltransferase involved in cell wall biosynthesis
MHVKSREAYFMSGSCYPRPRWLVLAGTISPYILALWDTVARLHSQEVRVVSRKRANGFSFAHEEGATATELVTHVEIPPRDLGLSLVSDLLSYDPGIVVVLGLTELYSLVTAALFRSSKKPPALVYMGDTNAQNLIARCKKQVGARIKLRVKRLVLPNIFDCSFDLGSTNAQASEILGLRERFFMPLYTVDYAALERTRDHSSWPARWAAMQPPRFLCVARLVPPKNLEALAHAWRTHLAADHPGSLVIVGEGPERSRIAKVTSGLECSRFLLAGAIAREEMGPVFRGADAVILPSMDEPWGIAVTEALGLGKPVLATESVGAARSLIDVAPGAILLSTNESSALARAIQDLQASLPRFAAAAQEASRRIQQLYGMEPVSARLSRWGEDHFTGARSAARGQRAP